MQAGDLRLLLVRQRVVHLEIPRRAQAVDLLRGALLQPVACACQPVGKLLPCIGRADLGKHGLQHGGVEVHDGAELNQQGHRHGLHRPSGDEAIIHHRHGILGRLAGAVLLQHPVKLKILPQDAVVKAEIERLGRLCLGVQPQDDLRLVQLQHGVRSQVQSGGAGHLAGQPLDTDELVALEHRRFVAVHQLGNPAAGLIGAGGGSVILSARLKIHALVHPAHCPVDLPAQLAVGVGIKVKAAVVAAGARIRRHAAVVIQRQDPGGILPADGAVDAHGIVRLALALGGVLRAHGIQNIEDGMALFQRRPDLLPVSAAAVQLRLMPVLHPDAEPLNGRLELALKVGGVGRGVGAEGVAHVHVGLADAVLQVGGIRQGGDIGRHLPHPVKLVPRQQEARPLALALQRFRHEQGGGDVPEIAYVPRSGGTVARRAGIDLLVGILFNDSLCDLV